MHRLLVALLSALDAAIAAAVGLVALLAPLTVLWVVAFGTGGDWGALWPTAATLWHFGHGADLSVTIPPEAVVAVGIDPDAASFTLGLAPLALLAFTVLFAARSGARAVKAGAWVTGVLCGTAAFGLLAVATALTGALDIAATPFWQAAVFPTLAYLVGALGGAIRAAWSRGDGGIVDRVRQWLDDEGEWGLVPESVVRGGSIAIAALFAASGIAFAGAVFAGASEGVALFESLRVDALGATIITLAQLAYVPTLLVWTIAWLAGPGFAVGAGTAVSPAGTELGVVPAVPVLGMLPEGTSMWALVVVLVPVAAGAFAGWAIRSRLVWDDGDPRMLPRLAIAGGIGALAAAFGAAAAVLASGSIGPGRLAETGPHPGALALALGVEVFIGAAILLLSPRHRDEVAAERSLADALWAAESAGSLDVDAPVGVAPSRPEAPAHAPDGDVTPPAPR